VVLGEGTVVADGPELPGAMVVLDGAPGFVAGVELPAGVEPVLMRATVGLWV
jgi:hypothetical protein